jgi:perosamine synthetase
VAVPPHCDSDSIGNHPIGEKNFILALTDMYKTTRLFIESEPNKSDFRGIDMDKGNLLYFNGNRCIHYNEPNDEGYIRISFDFRIILPSDYMKISKRICTKPRDKNLQRVPTPLLIGGYYQTSLNMNNWVFVNTPIPQSRPVFDEYEKEAVLAYMSDDVYMTEYKETVNLEHVIRTYMNVQHCIMTTSGTAALIVSLMALGIQKGDRVIVPAYTMVATLNSVKSVGAIPVIVDVSDKTYTLDVGEIKKHENIRAVIHVSLNNRDDNIQEIYEYCTRNDILLIEDAAQSTGCKKYGKYGIVSCYSLSTPKIISTGQGGFITTNDENIANKIRSIKNFGRKIGTCEEYIQMGLNFKFTDIQAVIGIEQMKKLDYRVSRYKEIFERYRTQLNIKDVNELPWFIDYETSYRNELIEFLKLHGIETRICYPSLSDEAVNAKRIAENGLFLPTHMKLSDDDIDYICLLIKCFETFKNVSE